MIGFFKNRLERQRESNPQVSLGQLELALMEILWSQGGCNVREVAQRLERPLAYTTVMTTLDRLYKKGLLDRHMPNRAFVYSSRMSREEWERRRAESILASLFSGGRPSRELLVSSFLDAAGRYDAALLDELERKVRTKRKELSRRGQP